MKVIGVAGPTACGKSDLGIFLAQRFGGEIISADSRQVFRGMDLGTGKISGEERRDAGCDLAVRARTFRVNPFVSGGISHWMLDIAEPEEMFSVAEFQALARALLERIDGRGRVPFVVGGTGLYIRSLVEGLVFADVEVAPQLKEELDRLPLETLQEKILLLDPQAPRRVDMKNPRRLARALGLLMSGAPSLEVLGRKEPPGFDSLVMGVRFSREEICRRIALRLDGRLEEGMAGEVERLLLKGVTPERLDSFGLEYRYLSRYLAGRLTYGEMREKLFTEICRFAKRQITWFNKYCGVVWIDDWQQAAELAESFLS